MIGKVKHKGHDGHKGFSFESFVSFVFKKDLRNPGDCARLGCVISAKVVDGGFCLLGTQPFLESLNGFVFPFFGRDDEVIAFGGQGFEIEPKR